MRALSGGGVLPPCALVLAGCDLLDPGTCTTEFVYGVTVEAFSEVDGTPVTEGLAGVLAEGSWSEEMMRVENWLLGAGERAGRYTATVTAPGFEPWSETGIRVDQGPCHVTRARLRADLVPTG